MEGVIFVKLCAIYCYFCLFRESDFGIRPIYVCVLLLEVFGASAERQLISVFYLLSCVGVAFILTVNKNLL